MQKFAQLRPQKNNNSIWHFACVQQAQQTLLTARVNSGSNGCSLQRAALHAVGTAVAAVTSAAGVAARTSCRAVAEQLTARNFGLLLRLALVWSLLLLAALSPSLLPSLPLLLFVFPFCYFQFLAWGLLALVSVTCQGLSASQRSGNFATVSNGLFSDSLSVCVCLCDSRACMCVCVLSACFIVFSFVVLCFVYYFACNCTKSRYSLPLPSHTLLLLILLFLNLNWTRFPIADLDRQKNFKRAPRDVVRLLPPSLLLPLFTLLSLSSILLPGQAMSSCSSPTIDRSFSFLFTVSGLQVLISHSIVVVLVLLRVLWPPISIPLPHCPYLRWPTKRVWIGCV